jgi:hypothetical protein
VVESQGIQNPPRTNQNIVYFEFFGHFTLNFIGGPSSELSSSRDVQDGTSFPSNKQGTNITLSEHASPTPTLNVRQFSISQCQHTIIFPWPYYLETRSAMNDCYDLNYEETTDKG